MGLPLSLIGHSYFFTVYITAKCCVLPSLDITYIRVISPTLGTVGKCPTVAEIVLTVYWCLNGFNYVYLFDMLEPTLSTFQGGQDTSRIK